MGRHIQTENIIGIFDQVAKSRRIDPDINHYKSFNDLFIAIEPFLVGDREVSGKKTEKANKVETKGRLWDIDDPMRKQADVLYDGDDYMILIPKQQMRRHILARIRIGVQHRVCLIIIMTKAI